MRNIEKQIEVDMAIEKVWPYVSTAEGIGAWFMPSDLEPVVGSSFELQAGPWGNSKCVVTAVEPGKCFAFDWGKDWNLSFQLEDRSGKTRVTVVHSGWRDGGETEFGQAHEVVQPRMDGGWSGLIQKLKQVVEESR